MHYDNYGNPIPPGPPHYGATPGAPGYAQPGAPPPYAGAPYGDQHGFGSELNEMKDNSMLWLLVGVIGFWFGFGWITGPLAWIKGSQLRSKYRALGHEPIGLATGAWITGIVTTLLTYLAMFAVFMLIVFAFSAVSAAF